MDIKNTLIGIWGFGRVGQAAARFFTAHNISFLVWDDALTIPHSAKSLDELLNTCDAILPSPGIDINPYLDQATWLNELDIFGHYFHKKIIAITGTVGKTTITTMITESLKNAGWRAIAAGNIGVPCFDIIEKQNELDVVVLEVSSFQLEHCKTFTPDLAIWTNFFPNHIDRHKTIDNYFNAKLNLLVRQTKNQHAILPVDLKDKIPALEPHVYYVTELGLDQNKQMKVPYFGNKLVLDWEENRKMQRLWMEEAQVKVPHRFRRGDKIDRPVIVKSYGAAGGKGYFVARNQKELDEKLKTFEEARFIVQEYVIGVPVYFHFFYSPLTEKIEVMSVDKRYETNVDSLGRIPAKNQKGLDIEPSFEVVANIPMAVRESLLADAMSMADRVINVSQKLMPPKGLFGPFCLETIVTSKEEIFVIEISARIVAGTNCFIDGSPYSYLLYDEPMSTGRRIAREIKNAVKQNKLKEVLD